MSKPYTGWWIFGQHGSMLASVIDRLDATTTDDGDLDRALGEMPGRLANIERLDADGFIPLLERPSGQDVATDDDD